MKNPLKLAAALFAATAFSLATGSAGKVADDILGYWAPNKDKLVEMMKKEMAKNGQADPAAIAMATNMASTMAEMLTLHLEEGTGTMHTPEGPDASGYRLSEVDEGARTFTITLQKEGDPDKTGTGKIEGDVLTMTIDGQTMAMDRVDEEAFEARKKKAAEFDPAKLFGPGAAPK